MAFCQLRVTGLLSTRGGAERTIENMNNDDRDPPVEREKQVNEKPTIGAPGPQPGGRPPYDDKGHYHEEWTYERER
jgi:hypothetical protein